MPFLSSPAIARIGFRSVGRGVQISDGARFYGASRIAIGDFCRVDDFALLSAGEAGIEVGRHVHIACFCSLQGDGLITLEDYCGISGRTAIYSSTDDFSGASMSGPTIPAEFRAVETAAVRVGRHSIVGAGSVVLPGVTLEVGATVAALSLVRDSVPPFTLVGGVPARKIGVRRRDLLELERQFEQSK